MAQAEVLRDRLNAYLVLWRWEYHICALKKEEFYLFKFSANINSALRVIDVYASATEFGIVTVSETRIRAKAELHTAITLYLAELNREETEGSFNIDPTSGRINYKTYLSAINSEPSLTDIARMVEAGFRAFDKHGDTLSLFLHDT